MKEKSNVCHSNGVLKVKRQKHPVYLRRKNKPKINTIETVAFLELGKKGV